MPKLLSLACALATVSSATSFSLVHPTTSQQQTFVGQKRLTPSTSRRHRNSSSSLQMVDTNILMGGAVAVASFAFGIGLVVFTESAGERGGGLSEDMSTKITGMLMEDVEVSSVADVTSLTDQLAKALEVSQLLLRCN
uniref:Uncharacterized protein n=1 Tax=Corethron hystrix TaxID=216773 RepID=A0A7S1B9G3_9STRA|mmetsp:Transcript_16600/g.37300  ORF Transcript_16600/g.37300 Transcript_16600/m.37300 type:complete len:138 (+) Transcript_16600:88-501(+)